MSKAPKILAIYCAGQATQLFIHWFALSFNLYNYKQIPFCTIVGVVLVLFMVAGTMLNNVTEDQGGEHINKPYIDYVKEHQTEEDNLDEVIKPIYVPDENRN